MGVVSDYVTELKKPYKIVKGYPETRHAYVPKILKKTEDFQKWEEFGYNYGLTIGKEPVHEACRNFMINDLLYCYLRVSHKVPSNTIAFSMPLKNFKIGNNCQDFVLVNPVEGHYSYKKLSEYVQVTYFNDKNGIQFLAGVCFYSNLAEKPCTLLTDERNLIGLEMDKHEPYPLQNRSKNSRYIERKRYGRYCSKAQKRVCVWTGKDDGQIVHVDTSYLVKENFTGCSECGQDFKNYKWEEEEKKEKKKNIPEAKEAEAVQDLLKDYDTIEDAINFDAISLH